ncbi:MAG: DUF1553 domain-containing protein [Pirellulales bacterium]
MHYLPSWPAIRNRPIVAIFYTICPSLFVLTFANLISGQVRSEPQLDFAGEVRPILSDKCLKCHGPDKAHRATDLRLDDEASVHSIAVDPTKLAESDLIKRIVSDDPSIQMPPPDSKMQLSQQEREVLQRWVLNGAKFSKHWAFESLKPVDVPKIPQDNLWRDSNNPLDSLVAKRLAELGLRPSPQADSETLVRRLYLDLIGLLPSEKQIDLFLSQPTADRYEKLVDELMSNPHFGERWAIDWLDAARYADTHGYQNDRYRATWPWRDWVVQALNENLPFDQFITWQLAGDLLPNATRQQILATAFNRLHRQTNEGGSIEEEFRNEYVADRVNTFGAAFLGLTLECARCHDHKYDPIGQREYYQLSAFFNNIDESGLYSHFTDAVPTPTLQLNTLEQQEKMDQLRKAISDKQRSLTDFQATDLSTAVQALASNAEKAATAIQERLKQSQIGHYSFESLAEKSKIINNIKPDAFGKTHDAPRLVDGKVSKAIELSGENSVTMKEGGDWERNQPFSFSLWLNIPRHFDRCVLLHRSRAWTDSASRGYELLIENGRLSAALIHFWPGNALRIVSKKPLPIQQWTQVTWTYDGSSLAAGMKLWVDGKSIETEVVRDSLSQAIKGGEANELTLGQRFRDVGFKSGLVDELRIFQAQLSDAECKMLYWLDTASDHLQSLVSSLTHDDLKQFVEFGDGQRTKIQADLFDLRGELAKLSDPIPEIMVMRELPGERPTFILRRGQYDAPTDPVQRGVLTKILPLRKTTTSFSAGRDTSRDTERSLSREDLAKWLTDPKHPLTARVAVNRIWQSLFGKGLVTTTEDFGLQGSSPSNPQLLDFLALHYIQSGWDTKQLIKLIVMSRVYQQSSNLTADLLAHDPENQWLARGPASRLSAEILRDAALSASGLLVDQIGGPPVKPYQPEGLWEEKSGEAYKRDTGEGSRRRSLYTFWKRTSPHPMMMTFDASNREVCVVRRQSTLTPLQTLVVLNDPQFVEAARALAESAISEYSQVDQRIASVFRRLTTRRPNEAELAVMQAMYQKQHDYFSNNREAADKFLAIGDHKSAANMDVVDLAALSAVAEGLMSFDEFVMKR